jgi:AcrR family transcriptional regulator
VNSPDEGRTLRQRHAQQTRAEVLEAARALFAEQGYAQTKVAQIAKQAGVALQTVYSSVGTKAEVLVALLETSRSDAGVPTRDQAALEATDPREIMRTGNGTLRAVMEQSGDVYRLLIDNAAADPDVAAAWEHAKGYIRMGVEAGVQRVAELDALAPGLSVDRAVDIISVVLSPRVYLGLIDRGWTHDEIEALFESMAISTVLDPQAL